MALANIVPGLYIHIGIICPFHGGLVGVTLIVPSSAKITVETVRALRSGHSDAVIPQRSLE
jgi:hypothetical protein